MATRDETNKIKAVLDEMEVRLTGYHFDECHIWIDLLTLVAYIIHIFL
jgi:hypothetical protein